LSTAPSTSSSDQVGRSRPTFSLTRWLPVVVWATCISWFSTGAFSAQSTNSYIDPVLRYFFGDLSPEAFRFAHTIIRKTAHFVEYAVLAVLVCRALTEPATRPLPSTVARAVVYCAVYACLDELHQMFVPKRSGSAYDTMLDTVGATVGALLFAWVRTARGYAPQGARPPAQLSARSRG
jgi:VanZ family protein